MRTALRQRYYQEEDLRERRPFSANDNAFTLNRAAGGYTATYPDYTQPAADASYNTYNLTDSYSGGRIATQRYGYDMPESRDERQRRLAAHNRLYEGRQRAIEEQEPVADYDPYAYQDTNYNYDYNYNYNYDGYDTTTADAPRSTAAYNTQAPAYNNVGQEVAQERYSAAPVASRYSYYRPEVLDQNNPARSIVDNYKAKLAQKDDTSRAIAPAQEVKKAESKTRLYENVSAQAKARPVKVLNMLTVYATVFIIVAILIATAAVMISTLIQDVSALESEVAATQSQLATQQAELGLYQNDDYIYAQAKGLDMTQSAPEHQVSLLDVKDDDNVGQNNWFDSVCDFLSSLLGS